MRGEKNSGPLQGDSNHQSERWCRQNHNHRYDSYNPESEYVEDTRKERVMKLVEEKAKECLEILNNEKIC